MLLWFAGLSILVVANVFRSTGLDYRFVALGALLPLLVDVPVGHRAVGHALIFPVGLFVAVMLVTTGRPRLLRRRLLCVPIGVFVGLVLSGAFTQDHVFLAARLVGGAPRGIRGPRGVLVDRRSVRPLPPRAPTRVLACRSAPGR